MLVIISDLQLQMVRPAKPYDPAPLELFEKVFGSGIRRIVAH